MAALVSWLLLLGTALLHPGMPCAVFWRRAIEVMAAFEVSTIKISEPAIDRGAFELLSALLNKDADKIDVGIEQFLVVLKLVLT